MSRVIKKKIKIPVSDGNKDISEMFNQMLGTGSINMAIAYPRYKVIKGIVEQIITLFGHLRDSPFMQKYKDYEKEKNQIAEFCALVSEQCKAMFSIDFSDYEWNLSLIEEQQRLEFATQYDKIKKSELINTFILICNNLVPYKKFIADVNNLNYVFITAMAGVEFRPFPFTTLNLKNVFAMQISDSTRKFFMTVLNKVFELTYSLWGEITSPDVDVDEFVKVIMSNIVEIQKVPELNRCKKAFKKIEESVSLLKNRFSSYYRDFIHTKTSSIMMEHFILDVSKSTNPDPETTQQFRRIIKYYKKIAAEQITNPKVKMLFDRVNDSFKQLEKNADNLVKIREEDNDVSKESESESESDEEDKQKKDAMNQKQEAEMKVREQNSQKTIEELLKEIEG